MNLFRSYIRPKGGLGDPKTSFAYCLKHICPGLGWAVNSSNRQTLDWATYFELAKEENGIEELSRVIFSKKTSKSTTSFGREAKWEATLGNGYW